MELSEALLTFAPGKNLPLSEAETMSQKATRQNRNDDNGNSYRGILKGISLFGGVKVFEILINLVRGKFVALILGPEGMGVNSIFSTSATTMTQISSLGLNLAIVKETAAAKSSPETLRIIAGVALRLTLLTALAGALLCLLFSSWLSRLSFGTDSYSWQFMLLGAAVALMVANGSRLSLLQGLHEVKRLSKASLVGSVTGLVAGVPLYYFFGLHGIVPAIIILSLSMYIFYTFNLQKSGVRFDAIGISLRGHGPLVRKLLGLGVVLVAGDVILNLCNYLLIIFVREQGSLDTVGLFQASASVTNQMASVVFAAMAMDYFPRLSALADDNASMIQAVNRQTEMITWVLLPLSMILVVAAPLVIQLLFSSKFESAIPLLRLMSVGILLKALSYPMGYITLVKDNRKLYFWMECIFANLLTLTALGGGYLLFGLDGLGWGMIVEQSVILLLYYVVNHRLYGYRPSPEALKAFAAAIPIAMIAVAGCLVDSDLWGNILRQVAAQAAAILAVINLIRLFRKRERE